MGERTTNVLKDNTTHQIVGQGDVSRRLNNGQIKEMSNVLHVLSLWKNLFSTKQLDQAGGEIIIRPSKCIQFFLKGIEIPQCILETNLYKLDVINKQEINEITLLESK
jgi:hypothetical protein